MLTIYFTDMGSQGCDIKIYYNEFNVMLEITDYESAQKIPRAIK